MSHLFLYKIKVGILNTKILNTKTMCRRRYVSNFNILQSFLKSEIFLTPILAGDKKI